MYAAALILSFICVESLEAGGIAFPTSDLEDFTAFSAEVLSLLGEPNGSVAVNVTQAPQGNLRGPPSGAWTLRNINASATAWPMPPRRLQADTPLPPDTPAVQPSQSSIDRISTDLTSNSATQALMAKAAYQGLTDLVTLLQAGAPASEIALHTFVTVGTVVGTGVAGVFPLAGAAITIFTSLLGGLVGGTNSDPQKALYDAIMLEVTNMINRNNLAIHLKTVQNRLLAIGDELSWVPDVLEETP